MMKGKYFFLVMFALVVGLITVSSAAAVDCWTITTQTTCESSANSASCQWHTDPWGSWCEQKGCWNFWTEVGCTNSNNVSSTDYFINKSCNWKSTSSGWCMMLDCWSFDGTNESACESNSQGIKCNWINTTSANSWDMPCNGPPEKSCWTYTTSAACTAVTGCKWGMCERESCWDQTTSAECALATGYNGKSCQWKSYSWGSECQEHGCWQYSDRTACVADNCTWDVGCMEQMCSTFAGKNASYCVNNTASLSCTWDTTWKSCMEKGCWNSYDATSCNAESGCFWETYSGGWCEEVGCWSWDRTSQANCEDNATAAGINCVWNDPWCYEDVSSKSCSNITLERDCMDTFYCWWNYSAGTSGTCNDPQVGVIETDFIGWNPGCYIFDTSQEACGNTTGCSYWTNVSLCKSNTTKDGPIYTIPATWNEQLNCSLVNNRTLCNSIATLDTCCKWQGSECTQDRFDQACRKEMQDPPEGAYYCEDYNAYTDNATCMKIAGDPWYMPCKWNNATDRCEFKGADVFGSGEKNIMKVDNQQNCEAAGGKWILETYPSTNEPATAVKKSLGRCDYKFEEERNCDKECFACDYKTDKTKWSTSQKAKDACIKSKTGICEFTADTTAPNGWGYCKPKAAFKQGLIAGDCDSDCGACTYMGDVSADSGYKPSDYCGKSKAKCKWVKDPAHSDDDSYSRCTSQTEKTCDSKCDKCYDETSCKNYGAKNGSASAATICEWTAGICKYKSGADQLEICWDGIDNNNDGKMDCADSMCYSDAFCGGAAMFSNFGKDCFSFTTLNDCEAEGCAWVNENWGSWCDMPGAVCWKKDGTNESYCEGGNATGGETATNATCEWHSGFGGFCEQNWEGGGGGMMNICMNYNITNCEIAQNNGSNCTWVHDTWCDNSGGRCDPTPAYVGAWHDCAQYDDDGEATCESSGALDANDAFPCTWYIDEWCQNQGANAGHCDHMSYACYQFDSNGLTTCEETTNETYNHGQWCRWHQDEFSGGGGWCEGKAMSTCWSKMQNECQADSSCSWIGGLCDPIGFGGQMTAGMGTGGAGGAGVATGNMMGGSGMQCMQYDSNQTACTATAGCSWMAESWPFCDMNFTSNCPQYSYNAGNCSAQANCKWNSQSNFCDAKPFECFWNTTLQNDLTACGAHAMCDNTSGCRPICHNMTIDASCNSVAQCRWVTGWCSPSMGVQFFTGMVMQGAPPIPLGTDPTGDSNTAETDIIGFGMRDMGDAYGFGVTVASTVNSSACNGIKISGGTSSTGKNTTKFYWYLDTDGVSTNNCALTHDSTKVGYEFYVKNEWSYDNNTGSISENPAAYRCASGNWTKAEIKISSERNVMCKEANGAMIAVEKADLKKFTDLYTAGADIRVAVVSANATNNATVPSDTASPGWVTPGSQDFDIPDLYEYTGSAGMLDKVKNNAMSSGFVDYATDANCWTEAGCADYACKGTPYCVQHEYGIDATGFSDTRIPKVIGMIKEVYPDSALIAYFTDKPANGTLKFYGNDSTCLASNLNATIQDPGMIDPTNIKQYKLWHLAEIYNDGGVYSLNYDLSNSTAYYYKIAICDDAGKCGESKCSNFTTELNTNCAFCKFVSKIDAPTGWEIYYDLDQDGVYEHWQGHVISTNEGMFTNYTTGRRANIKLNSTASHMEFLNVTLTKTGMAPKIRNVTATTAFSGGTTTDTAGNTIGYTGMAESTRDKIVYNLYPRKCQIKIPSDGTCTELYHCDDNRENCIDRTNNATLVETGTDYCIWQIPYCEFSTWASGVPSSSGGTTAAGAAGAAGGGGGGAARKTETKSKEFGSIPANSATTMEIVSSLIHITQIEITPMLMLSSTKLAVTNLLEKPAVTITPTQLVYQYLELKPTNLAEKNIKNAAITFTVEKSWLASQGADKEDVVLIRYADGKWNELETSFVSEGVLVYTYTSKTPGFSYFAIAAKKAEAPAPATPSLPAKEKEAEAPITKVKEAARAVIEASKDIWYWIIGILVIAAIVGYSYYQKGKKK